MPSLFNLLLTIPFALGVFASASSAPTTNCSSAAISSFLTQLKLPAPAAAKIRSAAEGQAVPLGLCEESAAASDVDRVKLACYASRLLLSSRNEYIDQSSDGYQNATEVNWSAACWLNANCILQPSSSEDIADILRIVTFFKSKFSTRSGGHNPNPGFASIPADGLLIDMVNFKALEFGNGRSSLVFGPGNRFRDVYAVLNGTGKFIVGGRVPDVGVGGYYLGGGMPTWSSLYGTGADNILRFEIVLANSTSVNVTSSQHSDLFWALKGGASNFGIVTQYEAATVLLPTVYYEALLYDPSQTPQLIDAVLKFQAAAEKDKNAGLVFNWSPTNVLIGFAYAGTTARPPIFAPFYALPTIGTYINYTIGTPSEMASAYAGVTNLAPARRMIFSVAHEPSADVYSTVYSKFLELYPQAATAYGGSLSFGIQPWTSEASKVGLGKNPLGLKPVSQNWMTGVIQWTDPAADAQALQTINAMANATIEAAVKAGVDLPFRFMNDANHAQVVLAGYGSANLARLRSISRKYDPTQLFQRQQVDGFLLSKA